MEEQVVCNQCERKFAKESSLRQHERDKHKIEQCKECGKKFEREKALKKHIWFVHKNKRRKKVKIRRISNEMKKELNFEEELRKGNVQAITTWLAEHVHKQTYIYEQRNFVKQVTGEEINPNYFIYYIEEKYEK